MAIWLAMFKTACFPIILYNRHLELTLFKGRQRFDAISTPNLEVYKFRDRWVFTYFIFGHDESSPNSIWSMVDLERRYLLLFKYFLYFKVDLNLEKQISLVNLHPTLFYGGESWPNYFGNRWIDGKSWPNDFIGKVNRGEDFRWVVSKYPLTRGFDR